LNPKTNERGVLPIILSVLVVILIIVTCLAVYNISKSRQKTTQTAKLPLPASSPATSAIPTSAALKIYTNSDFGLTFKYPNEYGEVNLSKNVGTYSNSPRFTGTFSTNPNIKFIVTSATYRDENANLLDTFRGHYESSGRTYYKWADSQYTGASPVQVSNPVKTLTVNGKKILIVNDNSFPHLDGPAIGPGLGKIAGLANLNGPAYPGVVFITNMSETELELILNTINV
jgi:hypothetical protein